MADPSAAGADDDDTVLASFLESEILSAGVEQEDTSEVRPAKRLRSNEGSQREASQIGTGTISKMPSELFHYIFKFLSSEDLMACALVCKFMSFAASDESLWRRLYCMRWGLGCSKGMLRQCAWKKLYIQRDQEDMNEFVRNTPSEFKEYYIQMQAAKRSQAPLPSQVDDRVLDRTVAEQVSMWKKSRGLTDDAANGHACSGNTCSYSQIGDAFICERTGCVHVCVDNCREAVFDAISGFMVCTISGQCFDRLLDPGDESETLQHDQDQQAAAAAEEPEPFWGSGRFARYYMLGYNCADEKELEDAWKFLP
ncbi:F-box protein SKIP31 [Curcuma longa]|uniref:F-box protein SKIP31 n=1 Tax=Curcuma longa TaxID=136217 RepID=UPI003D9EFE1D